MTKIANPDHPIEPTLARRWSPYVFSSRPVEPQILRSLFEAARWAASSFNEQPWRFLVAVQDDQEGFAKLLACLTPKNQEWAKQAPVLVITAVKTAFTANGKPNRVALHDLGLAAGNLSAEATVRGLSVHQMAGVDLEAARQAGAIPEGFEPATAIAIGYRGEPDQAAQPAHADRDAQERKRKPLSEIVFGPEFGRPASWLE
ncbi:MAG: nitroreductase [Acidobacteria bacterium]|nr:nitroreductase [Acidobacteriota bacterium]